METLSSTEKTNVDLIALRAWHWKASQDVERQPEIRRWHRNQVKYISVRLSKRTPGSLSADGKALVEMMTDRNAEETYRCVALAYAGDWQKLCDLTREAIIRKLEGSPPFDSLM